jgi:hypothetical protein
MFQQAEGLPHKTCLCQESKHEGRSKIQQSGSKLPHSKRYRELRMAPDFL